MAIWKAYRISDIITEVEDEKFVLPVIQRRLVWDEEKMELLRVNDSGIYGQSSTF